MLDGYGGGGRENSSKMMYSSFDNSMLGLGIGYLLTIFITYTFQYIKIYKTKSVTGISPSFLVLGNISSVTSFMNSLIFYFVVIHECFTIDIVECINKMLGLYQIGSQYLCFMIFYVMFVFYYRTNVVNVYPDFENLVQPLLSNENGNSNGNNRISEHHRRGYIVYYFIGMVLVDIILISVTVGLLSRNVWHGNDDLIIFARALGIISTLSVVTQYVPQIYSLYLTKNAKNLSVVTYILLAGGNFVSFLYLTFQSASDSTTWLPYLICLIMQSLLCVQIIYYEQRSRHLNVSIQYDRDNSDYGDIQY